MKKSFFELLLEKVCVKLHDKIRARAAEIFHKEELTHESIDRYLNTAFGYQKSLIGIRYGTLGFENRSVLNRFYSAFRTYVFYKLFG